MSTKGITLTQQTRYKISLSRQEKRTEAIRKLYEYIGIITDPNEKNVIPSLVSASLYIGMSKRSLLAWELTTAENSELPQLLDFIRDLEEKYLRENGLLNKINSKLATSILRADHGLREQPTQLTQNNTFNITPELLAEAIELSRQPKSKAKK